MSDTSAKKKFWGKYKATVAVNEDPELRGRITCFVPDVLGEVPSTWCEACAPLAGPTGFPMGVYLVPPIGAGVWVEFQNGDPSYPIWAGCRFATGDAPPFAFTGLPGSPSIVLQTLGENSITISDLPGEGGIMLMCTRSGASLTINDLGILIQNGKGASISMVETGIDFNQGALTILY
jgi:uncharacterized protein involved in type VI secretion and phage assembly